MLHKTELCWNIFFNVCSQSEVHCILRAISTINWRQQFKCNSALFYHSQLAGSPEMKTPYLCWKSADSFTAEITPSINGWYECKTKSFNSHILNLHDTLQLSAKSRNDHLKKKKSNAAHFLPHLRHVPLRVAVCVRACFCSMRCVSDQWLYEDPNLNHAFSIFMISRWDCVCEVKRCDNTLLLFVSVSVKLQKVMPSFCGFATNVEMFFF